MTNEDVSISLSDLRIICEKESYQMLGVSLDEAFTLLEEGMMTGETEVVFKLFRFLLGVFPTICALKVSEASRVLH